MATQTLQPGAAPANTIVQAYLAARAEDNRLDQSGEASDTFEARMAQFAAAGARDYAMSWGISSVDHGALVALLAANRLQYLIDGYSIRNDRDQQVVTFGPDELHEVSQIKHALVNLWLHLEPGPLNSLQPLAVDLGLIDDRGREI